MDTKRTKNKPTLVCDQETAPVLGEKKRRKQG